MSSSVCLIETPPYHLDLSKIESTYEKSLLNRVQNVAIIVIWTYGKLILCAFCDSALANLRSMKHSVHYAVFGWNGYIYRPPNNLEDLSIRIVLWVSLHILGVIVLFPIYIYNRIQALPSKLLQYADSHLNTEHLTCQNLTPDMSGVPDSVQVRYLQTFFDAIDFTDSNDPHYMPPSTRTSDTIMGTTKTYTPHELQRSLNTFIKRIATREAFIGTPPAIFPAQLMRFYQQLEDTVRFCIHQVNHNLENFLAGCGGNTPQPDDANYNEYIDLLKAKARLAIDFAIAGNHCGSRYMAEAAENYRLLRSDSESSLMTLRNHLIEVLSKKREEIARGHIEQFMGTDSHNFSMYMASLGQLLGIPGTENIIEYLGSHKFDRHKLLQCFFNVYDRNCIRNAIQAEIKNSQALRDKVLNWIKERVKDWNKSTFDQKVQTILDAFPTEDTSNSPATANENITLFLDVVDHLKKKGVSIDPQSHKTWADFVTEAMAEDHARTFLESKFSNRMSRMNKKTRAIQACLSQETALKAVISEEKDRSSLQAWINAQSWIAKAKEAFTSQNLPAPPDAVLERVQQGTLKREQAVINYLELERQNMFLSALAPLNNENEIKIEVLDWILISQGILNPPSDSV